MDSAPDSWKEGETTEGDTSMEGDTSISVIITLEISGLWGFESLGGRLIRPNFSPPDAHVVSKTKILQWG